MNPIDYVVIITVVLVVIIFGGVIAVTLRNKNNDPEQGIGK